MNQLEPESLLRHFLADPPLGFSAGLSPEGVATFATDFDLLTTTDPSSRRKIEGWPMYRYWRRLLRPRTRFVGSTVTEYVWLPGDTGAAELACSLRLTQGRDCMLLIVKDIPQASPLLAPAANRYAEAFLAACERQGFVLLEGQALAWAPIDFDSIDDYLARLSRGRRRDLRRKLRSRDKLEIERVPTGSSAFDDPLVIETFYRLYQNVFAQSELQFDLLQPAFFSKVFRENNGGIVFVYRAGGRMIGWNLCFEYGDMLVDKYIGLEYPAARDHNLYAVSWFENLSYARARGLRCYVAGWTDPLIKLQLGARLTLTRHAVFVRNPLLRWFLRRFSRYFESDRSLLEEQQTDAADHP